MEAGVRTSGLARPLRVHPSKSHPRSSSGPSARAWAQFNPSRRRGGYHEHSSAYLARLLPRLPGTAPGRSFNHPGCFRARAPMTRRAPRNVFNGRLPRRSGTRRGSRAASGPCAASPFSRRRQRRKRVGKPSVQLAASSSTTAAPSSTPRHIKRIANDGRRVHGRCLRMSSVVRADMCESTGARERRASRVNAHGALIHQ